MRSKKWIEKNIGNESLSGKTVAVTGTTGGLGRPLCEYLASLGASLLLLDRNHERSRAFASELLRKYPAVSVRCIKTEREDMENVRAVCDELEKNVPDVFIHNAGAYSIPRHKCSTGYDNVFQINFLSPYYMIRRLLPLMDEKKGKVVIVGSIAHNYSRSDPNDVDFSKRHRASQVYGNAKRYLMFSLYELFKDREGATLSVTHPGIAVTNITSHYPKLIYAIIKYPMKIIFMSPERAAISVLSGVFQNTDYHEWIGPRLFDIWGLPSLKKLRTVTDEESRMIGERAEKMWRELSDM